MKKMKNLAYLILLLCGAAGLNSCSDAVANSETEFWVRGNCDMCRETIETALNSVEGVASASYDLENHQASVSFDSLKTNPAALEAAVAAAGYDTKDQQALPEAYTALPKCCKKPKDR